MAYPTPDIIYDAKLKRIIAHSHPLPPLSGGGVGWTITATNYTELVTTYPPVDHNNEVALVINGQGVFLINRKPAGLYLSDGTTWNYLGRKQETFYDSNFKLANTADNTKVVKHDLSEITTGNIRTWKSQDKDGTVAYLSDIAAVGSISTDDTLSGDGSVGDPLIVELKSGQDIIILDAGHIASGSINLSSMPKYANSIALSVAGAGDQILDTDYTLSGSSIVWNGYGLAGILAVGDEIQVNYLKV